MLYTKTCEYALRALVYLSLREDNGYVQASQVGKDADVPGPYVSKIFQKLVRGGILKARRGVNGGVAYAKPPAEVSLYDVMELIDETTPLVGCVMGLDRCDKDNACPLHDIWSLSKEKMLTKLQKTSIQHLSRHADRFRFRDLKRLRLRNA